MISSASPSGQRLPDPPAARWSLTPQEPARAISLARVLGIHPAVARVMAARQWEDDEACREFLSPRLMGLRDPFELRDMSRAVERALHAIRAGERIAVFGDYDVDGVSSTALMVLTLRHLGADPVIFIPHRISDGYGMQTERMEDLARQDVKLVITVDTGVTASEPIARARDLGMDVIVTDHHLAEDSLPEAAAIVNPNRPDAFYEGGRLCGVGVAFKFAHALLKESGRDAGESKEFLRGLMDLVALGTIADVVPLLGENRILAHFGLEILTRTRRPGIRALLDVCGLTGRKLTAEHVGFALGPRINAAGRTAHANSALELLLTDNPHRAVELAKELEMLNRQRRNDENAILSPSLRQAESQMESGEDALLVVAGEDFHLGIVGIVAARLAERFHRPAIVLRSEAPTARGSARSIPGFDVHEALGHCGEMLIGYGGHAAAAGVRLEVGRIDPFRSAINAFARDIFEQQDLTPEITIDADVEANEITWEMFEDLQRLQPFGQDNPAPVFRLRGVMASGEVRVVGTNHLRMNVRAGQARFGTIGFNKGALRPLCDSGEPLDLVFRPQENTWRGQRRLELQLVDARLSA